ncbi:MAG: class I SAM-dependent methyltransferase [Hyphomicrobiales bacterium]
MASAVRTENGVPVGTSGGKYDSANPVSRFLIAQFDRAVSSICCLRQPTTILEVGCGEGHVTQLLLDNTDARILATDLSSMVLAEAEQTLSSRRVTYRAVDMMSLEPLTPSPDLVVCCEVLEHLPDPSSGLKRFWHNELRGTC